MRFSVLLLAAGFLCAAPAFADNLFTLGSGSNTVTFTLPNTITPNVSNSLAFQLQNQTIDVNGTILKNAALDFYTAADGGGIQIIDLDPIVLNLSGDQLFSGTTSDPFFTPGQFALRTYGSGPAADTLGLTISAVAPEPSSMFLLGSGLLGTAGILRRRVAH